MAPNLYNKYFQVGWTFGDQDSLEQIKLRILILKKMCSYGRSASKKAGELLFLWKQTGTKINPNLREVVYKFGMKEIGDADIWNWMLELYKTETNAQEKQKLLLGLTSVTEPWILSHLLVLANDPRFVCFLIHSQ